MRPLKRPYKSDSSDDARTSSVAIKSGRASYKDLTAMANTQPSGLITQRSEQWVSSAHVVYALK
jgi:hypothetical protein